MLEILQKTCAAPGKANERNYAIDLLRIIAMYMVCLIHINLYTKAHVDIIPRKEYFYYFGTWTESVGYIGVNLYALITGYVCLNSKWRLSRYLELWAQVAFYTISLLIVGLLLSHFGVLPWETSKKNMAKILLQLAAGSSYWYFAAYTALFLIIPFINGLLLSLRQRDYLLLLCVLMLVFPCISLLNSRVIYCDGYNVTWLVVLYSAGAYIKRFQPHLSPWILAPIAFICPLQPLMCRILHMPAYLRYHSPVMVVYSLSLFLLVYKCPINNGMLRKFIIWAAPVSFGVYLIHEHPWSRAMLASYVPVFNKYLDYPWWLAIIGGVVMYIVCVLVDEMRCRLFLLCRVRKSTDHMGRFIEKHVTQILNRLPSEDGQDGTRSE